MPPGRPPRRTTTTADDGESDQDYEPEPKSQRTSSSSQARTRQQSSQASIASQQAASQGTTTTTTTGASGATGAAERSLALQLALSEADKLMKKGKTELQELCAAQGLAVSGNKPDLAVRLVNAQMPDGELTVALLSESKPAK